MTNSSCPHDIVVLCYKEGWFCLDCQKIVNHDCGYSDTAYRYGITGFRVASEVGHREALKYAVANEQKRATK